MPDGEFRKCGGRGRATAGRTAIVGRRQQPPTTTMIDEDIRVAQVKCLRHAVEVGPDFGPDRASTESRIERSHDRFRVEHEQTGYPAIADGVTNKDPDRQPPGHLERPIEQ